MALQDLLALSNTKKKIGISEERIEAVKPILRKYIAFWRWYPDLLVDCLVRGPKVVTGEAFTPEEEKENKERFSFYFYQRVFLRCAMRFQYMYATFPRRICAGHVNGKNLLNCWEIPSGQSAAQVDYFIYWVQRLSFYGVKFNLKK